MCGEINNQSKPFVEIHMVIRKKPNFWKLNDTQLSSFREMTLQMINIKCDMCVIVIYFNDNFWIQIKTQINNYYIVTWYNSSLLFMKTLIMETTPNFKQIAYIDYTIPHPRWVFRPATNKIIKLFEKKNIFVSLEPLSSGCMINRYNEMYILLHIIHGENSYKKKKKS